MKQLWVEQYRPSSVDEYVFTNDTQRGQILEWVKEKMIPHILLHGSPGTGKTTLAKILVNELGIDDYDFLQVNASRDNGVEFLKSKIEGFVSTLPFGHLKVVLLDEADYLSPNAQGLLRGLMETYQSQARFILTCNNARKIMDAIHSRCQTFVIEKADKNDFAARAATVLVTEQVEFDLDTLDTYVAATYPDLRKCLNILQANSSTGTLIQPSANDKSIRDWRLEAVDLFKRGQMKQARTVICTQGSIDDIDSVFRWMYDNLELWSQTEAGQDEAIIAIRKGLVNSTMVADQEINLSATLCELTQIEV